MSIISIWNCGSLGCCSLQLNSHINSNRVYVFIVFRFTIKFSFPFPNNLLRIHALPEIYSQPFDSMNAEKPGEEPIYSTACESGVKGKFFRISYHIERCQI